jgi:hypothetical protein
MTRPEVEALLGEPFMLQLGGIQQTDAKGNRIPIHPDQGCWHFNHDGDGLDTIVSVSFDYDGKVSSKFSETLLVREPPFPIGLMQRLNRQWRTWFSN